MLAWAGLLLLAPLSAGCGGNSEGLFTEDAPCEPGATQSCSGPEACSGVQLCEADGSGYGDCDCETEGGGSGGGGTSGGGTSGGGTSGGGTSGGSGQAITDQADILFVLDNSLSMADKQVVLGAAMPPLLTRLAAPSCVDGTGNLSPRQGAECPAGTTSEFQAIDDIHVAVITSSLGAQGGIGPYCDKPKDDEHAYLLPVARGGAISGIDDFLRWGPGADLAQLASATSQLQSLVEAAGDQGCGFEATMESWYRFLIQPDPGTERIRVPCDAADTGENCVAESGLDQSLLAQRKAFFTNADGSERKSSLVAIVQLSDENDCSVSAHGIGHWMASEQILDTSDRMPAASAACETDPNDPCCYSCGNPKPVACVIADPTCTDVPRLSSDADRINLRCWNQKQRFGYDFLYPTTRYVDGLTESQVPDRHGQLHPNPLFSSENTGTTVRDPSLVFLTGIVGVPWQDLAQHPSAPGLRYMSAKELTDAGRWDAMLGDPSASPPVPPTDVFMQESVMERSGENPVTGDTLPSANDINGGDRPIATAMDLQYACIFQLQTPRDCTNGGSGCDCDPGSEDHLGNPLCDGSTQIGAKAYPGTRFLQVLKGFSDAMYEKSPQHIGENNAIAASICPKTYKDADPGSDSYGYTPAINAIVANLKRALPPQD